MLIVSLRERPEGHVDERSFNLPACPFHRLKSVEVAVQFAYQVSMDEPSPQNTRLALAGAVAVILMVGGAGFFLGRGTAEQPPVEVAPPQAAPKPTPKPRQVPAVVGRAELIRLAAAAADAAAGGSDLAPQIAQVAGRRFELRLPFGCHGPAREDSNDMMRWRYDAKDQALRIHVSPVSWGPQDWLEVNGVADVETIEGFWITRPWTSSEACPVEADRPTALGVEPLMIPGQTLALGQLFFEDGTRRGRRDGAPYESVVRIPEDALDVSEGLRLRISGRIARARGFGPIECRQPTNAEQRPICFVSVVMDELAIENPVSKKTLATWSATRRDASGS